MRRRGAMRAGRGAGRRSARRTMRRRRVLPMGRRYRRRRFMIGGATMLLIGGAAYKLGQSSVKQIEEYAGKPADQLTEQELEAAMDKLGIQEEEVTDADMAAIEAEAVDAAPAQPVAPAPPAAPAPPVPTQADYIEELKKLAELKDMGIVTQAEFDAKKKQLLGL